MKTQVLHTGPLAAHLQAQVEEQSHYLQTKNIKPNLAVLLVGENPASKVYVRKKAETCTKFGIGFNQINLPKTISQTDLFAELKRLNADDSITGILVQMPLPEHINAHEILNYIDTSKDVDGLNPTNSGRAMMDLSDKALLPATPLGILRILDWMKFDTKGTDAVMIGRSHLVGRPMADLLGSREATVTVCHKETKNLPRYTKEADLIVVATGVPGLIKGENVKKGAVIIDVGITDVAINENGGKRKLLGDVDAESCLGKASAITPVPGGVGPMTVASLLTNIIDACCLQNGMSKVTWEIPNIED